MSFQGSFYLSFYISCWYASQLRLIMQHSKISAARSEKIFFFFRSSKLKWTSKSFNMKTFSEVSRSPYFTEQLLSLLPRLFSAFNDQKHFQWRSTFDILTKCQTQPLEPFSKKYVQDCNFKETPTQVFSCEICEISKNTSSVCF